MIVDAHVHPARLDSLKLSFDQWLGAASDPDTVGSVYGPDGVIIPERFDALFEAEGVDRALLFCEYSPRVTGIQAIEHMLPLVAASPRRFRIVGNINPHLHYPIDAEVRRQLTLGAVAIKVHPVHGNFRPNDRALSGLRRVPGSGHPGDHAHRAEHVRGGQRAAG